MLKKLIIFLLSLLSHYYYHCCPLILINVHLINGFLLESIAQRNESRN
uniref:Uncharacterized protein n=1 Tax=Tetranychus urticae TaxID=32264 RepID=T1KYX1_TETUR